MLDAGTESQVELQVRMQVDTARTRTFLHPILCLIHPPIACKSDGDTLSDMKIEHLDRNFCCISNFPSGSLVAQAIRTCFPKFDASPKIKLSRISCTRDRLVSDEKLDAELYV
jgi:hypothetical protein